MSTLRRLRSSTIDGTFKIAKRKNRRFDYSFKLNNREQGFIKYRKRLSGFEITIDTNKNMILDKKSDLLLTQSSWESSFNTMPPWRQLKKAIGQRGEVRLTLMANDEPVINRRSLRNYRDNGYRRIIFEMEPVLDCSLPLSREYKLHDFDIAWIDSYEINKGTSSWRISENHGLYCT